MKRSWYLGLTRRDIGQACILVGDPARVDLFASRLSGASQVNEARGLLTITGLYDDTTVTVCAFGMGAPVAAIVLEELAQLGAQVVLRAGTAMTIAPELPLGTYVVASGGSRGEGTSRSYAPLEYPAIADGLLTTRVAEALARRNLPYRVGVMASYDGFYTEMLSSEADRAAQITQRFNQLRALRVYALDMETAAVLLVGSIRGIRVGSVCFISVDGSTHTVLEDGPRKKGEIDLAAVALEAVASVSRFDQSI